VRGFLFLVTGPSGAGKSSLLESLLVDPRFGFSVSATTRAPRGREVDGREYHFLDRAAFEAEIAADAFVEWAEVHGQLYGTLRREVNAMRQAGRIPVLDIDVQGGVQVIEKLGAEVVSVFVFPPSLDELERRLRGRATDSPEAIELRLRNARHEVTLADRYEYWVVNDDLERARADLAAISRSEGLKQARIDRSPLAG
jgi:guanylate kinase